MIGILKKMATEIPHVGAYCNTPLPVVYALRVGDTSTPLNSLIGKKINLRFTGKCQCIACGRESKKTFQQGYCFPCTQKLAETDLCIVKPELCHHHLGTCRDGEFATRHCFIHHVVYLAVSSDAKVGITREHQKFTRWADQGAAAAVVVATVPDRKTAGFVEVALAKHIADKTNWRKLLMQDAPEIDLIKLKTQLSEQLPEEVKTFITPNQDVHRLIYPVLRYPVKINSYNFDKNPEINDTLIGIKGQYLLFENGVINIRKFQGYEIDFNINSD